MGVLGLAIPFPPPSSSLPPPSPSFNRHNKRLFTFVYITTTEICPDPDSEDFVSLQIYEMQLQDLLPSLMHGKYMVMYM